MPARSFVVDDGVCILEEHAKPTTRARLPKRVRPTLPVLGQHPGGCKEFSPAWEWRGFTLLELPVVSNVGDNQCGY